MDTSIQFASSPVFMWLVLPVLIFVSRVFDVSLGTLRMIFTVVCRKVLEGKSLQPIREGNHKKAKEGFRRIAAF